MLHALPKSLHPNDHLPALDSWILFVCLQNHLHSRSFMLVTGRPYVHILRISENTFKSKIRRELNSPKAK